MSDPLVVDVHVHLFQEADDPLRDSYEIWEYGPAGEVETGERGGTVADLTNSLAARPDTHCVVLGMFVPDAAVLGQSDGAALETQRLQEENEWLLSAAERSPHLTPLIASDPTVLGGGAGAEQLRAAAERGAKGTKIHPVLQGFHPSDPRLDDLYTACEEGGLTVLSHSGTTRGSRQLSNPFAFAAVLDEHPGLHLVLAHLGGASWPEIAEFAAAYPSVSFDLCEIIAWTGAPNAPSRDQLGRLIRDIGSDRVLFGTDFPWYELEATIDQLMDLPHLSDEERRGILGENAARRMGLRVA
jgi:predicted TIM-barrel fold metal-dependent hydrolase